MTWTYTDEYYKRYTRDTWNESAAHYGQLARNLDLYNPALLKLSGARPGERALDVATGRGEPALTVAGAVGPAGSVLGVDLAEEMVTIARAEAERRGIRNARFETMDAEKLDLEDAAFDLVTCRFGLQIVTDPDRAAAEMARVTRPGGRAVASVWTNGDANPHIHAIVGPMLEYAEPDETGYLPTPYEMGEPGQLAEILRKAGFSEVLEERVRQIHTWPTMEAYFDSLLKGTPIGHSLSEEDPPVQRDVLAKARENAKRWLGADGLRVPGEAIVVRAVK